MQVSIVIPVYNALALTKQCVKSIYENGSKLSFEVIVVDNGSAPDVEQWLLKEQADHDHLRYLRYAEPLGFARSVNAGAAAATGDVLIILNSDTIVTPQWMDELHRILLEDPSLGAITPSTNHSGEPAQMDFGTIDLPPAKALAKVARRSRVPTVLYLPQRITFFCVALRRDVWTSFHGLDEAYRVGNFEDDDLCLRLRVAGYRLAVALHVFLYHHNNATFSANKISHSGWMAQNAATFAEHARRFAEAEPAATRWPKRSIYDISVVVLPKAGGTLDRTLRSLANQTIIDFEVLLPGANQEPTRTWIAYVTQGDILYPFHLEALWDVLDRSGSESVYADGWIRNTDAPVAHPDTLKQIRTAPLLLSGWMHHASLHRERLWEESVPLHWPRITWEMQKAPVFEKLPQADKRTPTVIEIARKTYRRLVPLETRLTVDRRVRKLIRRPLPDPDVVQLEKLTAYLDDLLASKVDANKFSGDSSLPTIFLFNTISWNTAVQRQHHFARGLADRGHRVFWVEPSLSPLRNWTTGRPLQEVAPDIFLIRLPGLTRDAYSMEWNDTVAHTMAAALSQTASTYGAAQCVALVNYPRWQPLIQILQQERGWKLAKDCLDDQRAFSDMYQLVLGDYEDWLVDHADLLITSSVVLQMRLQPRTSVLLHNGADYDLFSSATSSGQLQHLPRPLIGFFGALADWLDMELIHAAALEFPEWTFVYIGPSTFSNTDTEVDWIRSTNLPNIVVLPQMDPRPLAAHLAEFDVCIMPFLDIPVTRSMNPVKIYEYLAAGKPTVCRNLPEVRFLLEGGARGLISLYTTPAEFFQQLREAVAEENPDLRERRQAFARANDWNDRVDVLAAMIANLFPH